MSTRKTNDPELLDEYDFRGAARGKYAAKYAEGRTVVLDQAVAKSFSTSAEGPPERPPDRDDD